MSFQEVVSAGGEGAWRGAGDGASSCELLEKQAGRESNARTYARHLGLALRSAQGIRVTDVSGRHYVDCLAGAGTLALGHNHPAVLAAVRKTLDDELPLHTLDITTPVKEAFVDELFASLPVGMRRGWKVQFCSPSGADAVEAAVKLVKTATGRANMIAFQGAYHGMTHGALALTGNVATKERVRDLMGAVHFMPFPYRYRCPFGLGDEDGKVAARFFEQALRDPDGGVVRPAGVIVEAVQGEGGVIPAPDAWLREVRRVTRDMGIPLILDEVQAGIGRTGHMYAFERSGIEPDVVILSKAIGGSLPLAVIVYREELDVWTSGAHTGTFRGNQLAMAAGRVTLHMVRQPDFLANVRRQGQRLGDAFRLAQKSRAFIGDVRQVGLMVGLELVNVKGEVDHVGAYPAWPALAQLMRKKALERGLILELGGRHGCVVRLLPPLVVNDSDMEMIVERVIEAMDEAVACLERSVVG